MPTFRMLALLACASIAAPSQDLSEEILAAARKGDLEAVKALVEKGAPVDAKTSYGVTPLFFATRNGHVEVVRYLIGKGADVTVKDSFYGMTAFGEAVNKPTPEILKLYLAKGVNQQMLDDALLSAKRANKAEAAELIEKAGGKLPPAPSFKVPEETLRTYAGLYKGDFDLTIVFKEGKLYGQGPGGPPLELGAFDAVTFQPPLMPQIKLVFELEAGKVRRLTVNQGGRAMTLQKQEESK